MLLPPVNPADGLTLDVLGAAHPKFPRKDLFSILPRGWHLCAFWDEFGDAYGFLRRALGKHGVPSIETHMDWSNHKPPSMSKLKRELPGVEKLAKEFKPHGQQVYVTAACEQTAGEAIVRAQLRLIRDLAPTCIPVVSVYNGYNVPGQINEYHVGTDFVPPMNPAMVDYIVSTDGAAEGQGHYGVDAEKWLRRYRTARRKKLWAPLFNGREFPDPDQSVPPIDERTAWPDKPYIKGILRLGYDEGDAPELEPRAAVNAPVPIPIESPNVWKSYAEDNQGISDPRENKPVFIVDYSVPFLEVITFRWQKLGTMACYGGFGAHQHRYYAGRWPGPGMGNINQNGFQIAQRALALSGSEFVFLRAPGGRIYGPVNPAFRRGYFRG